MDVAIKIIQFIASFSLIVLVHELGHFVFARMFGVRVEKFYLFFNPWFSLVKFHYKGTEYGIGWIPFGGYCKIAGMIDESMDTESLKQPPKPDEFRTKPAWQRLLIMIGGVTMNVVLALCIYIGANYVWGEKYLSNPDLAQGSVYNDLAKEMGFRDGDHIVSVNGVSFEDYYDIYPAMVMDMPATVEIKRQGKTADLELDNKYQSQMLESHDFMSPRVPFIIGKVSKGGGADKAGLKEGDIPVSVDGQDVSFHDQISSILSQHKGGTVEMTVKRDSAGMKKPVTFTVEVSPEGMIGVANIGVDELPIRQHRYSFAQSIPAGFKKTSKELKNYFKQLGMIADPETKAYKSVGGVMAIANIFPSFWNWQLFWHTTAFISIVLAIMNLIPLPVLDGGHVMFLLYEVVSGRKPSDKFLEIATTIGILILFAVLLLANGNDIYRFLIK